MKNKKYSGIRYIASTLNPFSKFIQTKDEKSGLEYLAYKKDAIGRSLFRTGRYEATLSDWIIQKFQNTTGNFFDVGANLGYYTCLFSKISNSRSKIVSIEPEPENYQLLIKNIEFNKIKNANTYPLAVGATEGFLTLNIYKNSNRGRHSAIAEGSGKKIQVPVRKIDDIAKKEFPSNENISLLKIDVEGFEPFVLQGGIETIKRTNFMVMEYAPYILNTSPNEKIKLLSILSENFSTIQIVENEKIISTTIEYLKEINNSVDLILGK